MRNLSRLENTRLFSATFSLSPPPPSAARTRSEQWKDTIGSDRSSVSRIGVKRLRNALVAAREKRDERANVHFSLARRRRGASIYARPYRLATNTPCIRASIPSAFALAGETPRVWDARVVTVSQEGSSPLLYRSRYSGAAARFVQWCSIRSDSSFLSLSPSLSLSFAFPRFNPDNLDPTRA